MSALTGSGLSPDAPWKEEDLSFVSPACTLQTVPLHPPTQPALPHLPSASDSGWVEGPGGSGRGDLGHGAVSLHLHLCICQRRRGGLGMRSGGTHSTDGFLPPPFLTLTLCPCVGWGPVERPPQRGPLPSTAAVGELAGRGLTAFKQGPWSIAPRLFIPYSVAFLFYFTLIMIIQEYYLR